MPPVVATLFLLLPLARCLDPGSKTKAQVVQDYVLAANFDGSPQVRRRNYDKEFEDALHRKEDPTGLGAYYGETEAKDRDLVLPGGHLPPHPPPSTISPYSVFAVGFISFLILLSSLQASLTMMVEHSGGLLGGLLGGNKPAGRRKKRSAIGERSCLRNRT